MIVLRAVRVLDAVEVVVRCEHNAVSQEGHTLFHATCDLPEGDAADVMGVLADVTARLLVRARKTQEDYTDDCGW